MRKRPKTGAARRDGYVKQEWNVNLTEGLVHARHVC